MIISDNLHLKTKDTSIALGFFDGIHNAHKKVLNSAISYSKKLGTQSAVITFRNHPVEVLWDVKPEFITTYEERIEIFKNMGFDIIIMADFTKELALTNAENYYKNVISKFNPKSISVGFNFRFGANQSGDIDFLEKKAKEDDFILDVTENIKSKNEIISSTLIRNTIKQGNMKKVRELLGYNYKIKSKVLKGANRGEKIDYRTANLLIPEKKVIPAFGVYKGIITVENKKYDAIANFGLRPTFSDIETPLLEIHIFDFEKNVYDKYVEFEFIDFLRNEIKFKNENELKKQIKEDIKIAFGK